MNKVSLERQENIKAIAFGYMHANPDALFFPVAIATSDQAIYIYRDDLADDYKDGRYFYRIRKFVHYEKIDYVYHETYRKNLDYKDYGKITILFKKDEEKPLDIYYRKEDKVEMLGFISTLKKQGLRVKHASINKLPLFYEYN